MARHVGRLSVEVHRHDRPRPRRERGGARGGIHRQRVGLDVDDSTGIAPAGDDRETGERRRHRRHDHFVARADAERAQRERDARRCRCRRRQRTRAPQARANSVSNASTSGPRTNQPRLDDARDRRCDVRGVFTATEISERKWRRVVHDTATGDPLGT